MNQYQEILTKAILGRTKKNFETNYDIEGNDEVDTVLGCWVINHTFHGTQFKNSVLVNGSFDINVWYSYAGNSKTNVLTKTFTYEEEIPVTTTLENDVEIKVNSLKQPTVTDVSLDNGVLHLTVDKELGIELVGDKQIRVPYELWEPNYVEASSMEVDPNYIK